MKNLRQVCQLVLLSLLFAMFACAQFETGELRVKITDPSGLPLPASIRLSSEASRTQRESKANTKGEFLFENLPFGDYVVAIEYPGFAPFSKLISIHSHTARELAVRLAVRSASTEINVSERATLLDTRRTGVLYSAGPRLLREEQPAVPGRGVLDLINMQPGWLFEGNGVLHPRGSEYQTLFVVNGVPMDENRSPGFAPTFQTSNISQMEVMTGNIPAEYGRKLGGVVEIHTTEDMRQGFHGSAALGGGSFGDEEGFFSGAYGWNRSALTLSASGERTDRYLDPPVLGNFTNTATLGRVTGSYDIDLTPSDRLHFSAHRSQARFEVPNENLQQAAGQRQDRTTPEDAGQVSWSHIFSANTLLNVRGSVEDLSANLWSNSFSTPIIAAQQRGFRRGYVNVDLSEDKGPHNLNFGGDAIYNPVTEALQYRITNPSFFDPGTALSFRFSDRRLDREQALWGQDDVHLGNLTLSAGLRFDHYSFVVHDNAFSPRLGAAWYIRSADLVLRFSYDRVFETPATENLLLASSPAVTQLEPEALRIPLSPSRGNYFETGFSKGIFKTARLDVSLYRRAFSNFADDDVFLNTGISFPIAFRSAQVHGVDVKLDLPRWGKLSGFLSYSNMHGVAQLPVAGGLFLGGDAEELLATNSSFPISQDQRNSARGHVRYQITPRLWASLSAEYGSGLPVELENDVDIETLTAEYGPQIISRVNFAAGRVRPNFSLDANAGADLWRREKSLVSIEVSAENLTNELNLIDFAGLFSGNAIEPPRSATARLRYQF